MTLRSSAQADNSSFLTVVVADHGTTRTITPMGELDVSSVPEARAALDAAMADGYEIVVLDLGQTTFMDTSGVHLVLDVSTQAKFRAARFVLLPGPPAVQRVFELCGFSGLLPGPAVSHQDAG